MDAQGEIPAKKLKMWVSALLHLLGLSFATRNRSARGGGCVHAMVRSPPKHIYIFWAYALNTNAPMPPDQAVQAWELCVISECIILCNY